MIDERLQDLAGLYALDLLEGGELSAFEGDLARNDELQAFVRQLKEAGAMLAFTAPSATPPAELKTRILAALPSPATAKPAAPPATSGGPIPFRVLIPWAIAAGFAVTCAWLGQLYLTSRAETALLRDQQALADLEIIGARHQVEAERILANRQLADNKRHLAQLDQQIDQSTRQLAEARRQIVEVGARLVATHTDLNRTRQELASTAAEVASLQERLKTEGDLAQFKIATLASLAGNSPQALAVAVWNPSTQQGVLRVEKLPALASDKDYQLWVIDPAYAQPVDGGVFTVDPATGEARINFKPHQHVANATKFAVSLERKGGVPKAEGPILLLGD